MNQDTFFPPHLLLGAVALVAASPLEDSGARHRTGDPRDEGPRTAGCCSAWIDILENDGFVRTTEASAGTLLMRYKLDNGIPQEMVSCHIGRVDGYMIEGHVPAADIRRLLVERPDAGRPCSARHALRIARHGPGVAARGLFRLPDPS